MLCEECGLKEAIVNYSRIEDNVMKEVHICGDCLQKHLTEDIYTPLFTDQEFSSFMEQIFSMLIGEETHLMDTVKCKYCGTSLKDFKDTSLLGCSHCYETFSKEIEQLLPKLQGATAHIGYDESQEESNSLAEEDQTLSPEVQAELYELEEALKKSIEEERYEDSAVLRDKIKALKEETMK